jgi:proline iminopeptidase
MLYDHSMLWPALSPLAAKRQVILYDQRGRGESTAPQHPAASTIDDDAADVGALRRALGIRVWDVLGHSWGGGIAMLATARDLAGVRKLVLVDAVGATATWMATLRENVLRRLRGEQRDAVARISEESLGAADAVLHSTYARAVYPAWFTDPEMAERFTPPHALSETGAAVLARLRRDGYDWQPIVRNITTPTLVIHGEQDALPPAVSRANSYTIANARFEAIPGSGHMPFWEAPAPFFSLVDSFLSPIS